MPIDASIYRNIEQPPSTLQTLGAIQQFQQRGMEIQAQQRQLAAQQQLDQAYAGALTKDENGNPKIDENALFSHIPGHLIPATMEQFAKTKKSVADLQEAQGKVSQLHADLMGNLASTVQASGNDVPTFMRALKLAQANGWVDGQTATHYSMKAIEGGPAAVQEIVNGVLAGSTERSKLQNARDIANIRAKKGLEQKSGVLNGQQVQGVFDPNSGTTTVAGKDVTNQFQPATAALNAEQQLQKPLVEANTKKAQAEADQLAALNGMTGPASQFPDVQPGQKNEPFLASLPAGLASQVKLMAEGKLAVPSGAALRAPYWQGLLQATAKYDPSFDAVNYNARNKTRLAFTSGKEAGQINAINTAIGHLDTLSRAADGLNNWHEGALGPFTTAANAVRNQVSQSSGSKSVTDFNVTRKAVADELTRVWRQAGGSEADIQENLKNLSSANTPEQLHGAIATFGDLLESKLGSMNEQYRQGMGTDKIDILTPKARATLTRLEQKAGKAAGSLTGNLPGGGSAEAAPAQSGTPAVGATMQKFGATYKWDGTHYVKQ